MKVHYGLQFAKVKRDSTYFWQGYNKPSTLKNAGEDVNCKLSEKSHSNTCP